MLEVKVEKCAGIDVGKKFLAVCVLMGLANQKPVGEVRRFGTSEKELERLRTWLLESGCTEAVMESTGSKDKLFKRHAARIRRPSAGFCGVWRRHIMRFMLTLGESCLGLPQLFRRRVKISAVGGRDAAGGGYTYPELQFAMVIRRRREVAGRRPPPPEAGVTEFRGDPESDP